MHSLKLNELLKFILLLSLYIEEDVEIQGGAQKMFLTYPASQTDMTHHKKDLWSSGEKWSTGLFMLEKTRFES